MIRGWCVIFILAGFGQNLVALHFSTFIQRFQRKEVTNIGTNKLETSQIYNELGRYKQLLCSPLYDSYVYLCAKNVMITN